MNYIVNNKISYLSSWNLEIADNCARRNKGIIWAHIDGSSTTYFATLVNVPPTSTANIIADYRIYPDTIPDKIFS